MVIETEEHAKARGAQPLARLMGAGITSDAFHMVAPAADGLRAGQAMKRSMETCGPGPQGHRARQRPRHGHPDR